jgi:hypothetical protein
VYTYFLLPETKVSMSHLSLRISAPARAAPSSACLRL